MIMGVIFSLFIFSSHQVQAAPRSEAYLAIDVNTGRVLASKNADSLRHPASLTKMMTLYVLFDAVEAGKVHMNSRLHVSRNAASKPASKLYLKSGSTITVRDAIDALIVKSANDVATVVAENLSGTEPNFAKLMTTTARSIGMSKTTFINASGLHDERQVTTARDMYTLGLSLQDRFPILYTRFKQSSFEFKGNRIGGHNPFLGKWRGVDGIKTGYTRASGFNLVSNYKLGNKHIVAVVVGSSSSSARNRTMASILNNAIPRTSSTWRRTAKLDADLYIAVNFNPKSPQRSVPVLTASLVPQALPDAWAPSGINPKVDITIVTYATKSAKKIPQRKPQLFIDHPNFFARDSEVMAIMIETYQEAHENKYGTKKVAEINSDTNPQSPTRLRRWTGDVSDYENSTSNVNYSKSDYEAVSCMESNTCYVSGVVKTKGGHYRVENSEIFALVTSSASE
jgi:D-alanyl-D-alanine carboxypeptidase